jgi:hypothetical protein
MLDSGAEISLMQPYLGDQPVDNTHHMVRGITGDLLRAECSCHVQFKLGSRCYTHSFMVAPFPIERDGVLGLDWMRSMCVKIDLAHDQLEVAGERIPLRSATVGPENPEGQSTAEMSVEERRAEVRARDAPPPEREWTAVEAEESREGQRTLGGGCDPQVPTQPLREGEEMSVEERRTELEEREEPPPERERPAVETKESIREKRKTLDGGCDPQTPGQPLEEGEERREMEKERGYPVVRECRTMPQQRSDDSAESERDRNAEIGSRRHSTSDE